MNNPQALILLPRLQVQNANAVSGPLSWGFPSPTAFTGFVHALQRRLAENQTTQLGGVGIVCHKFQPQVTKPAGKYTQVLNLTRNPLGKDGNSAAIVEEGRTHMEISLLFVYHGYIDEDDEEELLQDIMHTAHSMRIAGGSVLPQRTGNQYQPVCMRLSHDVASQEKEFRKLRRKLLPGFALVQRPDRLQTHLKEIQTDKPHATALDALMDLTRLNIEPPVVNSGDTASDEAEESKWHVRKQSGWLVPIPVGYAAISPLYAAGEVINARDQETPFRFVENLYSLGEWVSPHRLNNLQQLLWHTQSDSEAGIYQCKNLYSNFINETIDQ